MAHRTITALYPTRAEAEEAKRTLEAAGIGDVDLHDQDTADCKTDTARHEGFMEKLRNLFGGHHHDAHLYGEGVRRGHTLLTVKADELQETRVAEMLEAGKSMNIDQTRANWRNEGWTPPATAGSGAQENAAQESLTGGPMGGAAAEADVGRERIYPSVRSYLSGSTVPQSSVQR